jgi:hypothetical protein
MQQKEAKRTGDSMQKNFKNNANTVPFNASISNVMNANFLFPVLRTFVAPVLLEPNSLRSIPLENFVNKNPLGIEPTIYPIAHAISRFTKRT